MQRRAQVWDRTRDSALPASSGLTLTSLVETTPSGKPHNTQSFKTRAYRNHDVIDVSLSLTVTWDLVHLRPALYSSSTVLLCDLLVTCAEQFS